MKENFIFDFNWRRTDSRPFRITVVFFPKDTITEPQCRDILQQHLDPKYDAPPDVVLLLGTQALKDLLNQLCTSRLIIDSIPSFTRHSDPPPLRGIYLSTAGMFLPCSEAAEPFTKREFIKELQKQGMLRIAQTNPRTVIESTGALHYVKPSGDHTDRFIRAANALVKSSEIAFTALWLVPFLTDDIDVVYTDTAGINGVVFNAILLKTQTDKEWKAPYVDSFSSYKGLDTYRFTSLRRALFVISASTSGALADRVKMKFGIHKSRIITLFYLGSQSANPEQILCDITKAAGGFQEPATNYDANECLFCQSNIPAISIDGDQFLLGHVEPHSELIQLRSIPEWLRPFVSEFIGKSVFRAYRGDAAEPERSRELYIDLEKIYPQKANHSAGSDLLTRLDRKLSHCLPVTLQHIVYIDDPGSQALAERVKSYVQRHWKNRAISIIPHTSLPVNDLEQSELAKGTLLLVAGTLVTGQRIMSVNQRLRHRSDDSVVYFVGITRTRDEERLKEVRNNIEFARDGSKHPFFSVADIFIPDDELSRDIPWDVELKEWRSFRKFVLKQSNPDRELLKWIQQRSSTLQKNRVNGLLNELFLPNVYGGRLSIRPGFAFWRFPYNKDLVSQADVYFSVAAVLHRWREEHARKVGDFSRRYGRVIISPKNFYRYNDGIIQACILRAAKQGELDYRYDQQLSDAMGNVLDSVFSNFDNSGGEATLEFLLALVTKQLNLAQRPLWAPVAALEERLSEAGLERRFTGAGVYIRIARKLCSAILTDVKSRTI